MAEVDQKTFAELVGATKQRISAAIKSGILVESVRQDGVGRGGNPIYKIDAEKGKAEWDANRDITRIPDPDKAEAQRILSKGLNDADGADRDDSGNKVPAYQKSKSIAAAFEAKLKQLDYLERAKKLISVDDVKAEYFKRGRLLRDAIMVIPGRVSSELANMDDAHAIEVFLTNHLAEALEDLGRGIS